MSNELTVIAPKSLTEAKELATTLAAAHTLPAALQKAPADVLAIVLTGAELGLAPMQAIRGLAIIKGKPVLSADAMGALVKRRRDICEYLTCSETTATKAAFETKRSGDPKPTTLTFTLEQAQRAGIAGGDSWRKYPEAMLRARALSAICRLVYPDLLLGVYDPDELADAGPERDVTPAPEPVREVRAKPKLAARRATVVDVKPGESEAEAIARTAETMTEQPPPTDERAESEALRRRARGVWDAAKKGGMEPGAFALWVAHVLGEKKPSNAWTLDDIVKLEAGLPEDVRPKSQPDPGDVPF